MKSVLLAIRELRFHREALPEEQLQRMSSTP